MTLNPPADSAYSGYFKGSDACSTAPPPHRPTAPPPHRPTAPPRHRATAPPPHRPHDPSGPHRPIAYMTLNPPPPDSVHSEYFKGSEFFKGSDACPTHTAPTAHMTPPPRSCLPPLAAQPTCTRCPRDSPPAGLSVFRVFQGLRRMPNPHRHTGPLVT